MVIIFMVIVLIFVYLIFIYLRIKYYLKRAGLVKPDQGGKILGTGPALRYIAAGDSTAVGFGASSLDKTYTYRLAKYLATNHTIDYKNIAKIGGVTKDVVLNQLPEIEKYNPDIVTISIGANDIMGWVGSGEIIANYKTIIRELTARTHAKIYISAIAGVDTATLLPLFYRRILAWRVNKLNKQIVALETPRVKIVNIREFGWHNYADLSLTFAADKFHPNDEGYNNWTNAFIDRIDKDF